MKTNPKLKIEIGGHTDNVGTKAYNKTLSENRANSVYNYLISKGIDKTRLSYKGYDFSVPVATNDTEEGRALNRRTEFKVISNR
jgi:outer membrane protein OmpA-like peptidoglycan-associated protein